MNSLIKTAGFFPYIIVVFLNAFTDLAHKIIIQNTIFKVYDGTEQIVLTAIVNGLILLPFILLFSPAGFISDKFAKHIVMRISAIAAVIITSFITFSYYMGWFWVAFIFTFILAMQSAIYSPAKYGYIKELLGANNIAFGNGIVQSTTIVAILAGIFAYSVGFELFLGENINSKETILQDIAPLGWFLILGSLIELKFTYSIPNKSNPLIKKQFSYSAYLKGKYLKKNMKLLTKNQLIWLSIIGLSIFWALSQVILATFPSYVKEYLEINNVIIVQALMALSAIGIIIGSLVASYISKNYIEVGMIPLGALGIFLSILFIPMIDSLILSGFNFFMFGIFGGLILVPLNSLIQFNASKKRLGLILAGSNFVQNIFMFVFLVATVLVAFIDIGSVEIFYILALIALVGAIYTVYKLPQSLIKLFISLMVSLKYRLIVQGIENIPQNKGVLLLGNHISWLDWAFVQMATPRPIRFVMERTIYEKKLFKPFLKFFGVIPISNKGGKNSLKKVSDHLNNGGVVSIFPEGTISRNGHLGEFKKGFELATQNLNDKNAVIIPFFIGGLWGTKWSRSNINFNEIKQSRFKKDVIVSFGKPKPISQSANKVKQDVFELSVDSWNRYINSFTNIDEIYINSVKRQGSNIAIVDSTTGDEFSFYKVFTLSIIFKNIIKKQNEQNIGLLLPTTSIGAIMNMAIMMSSKTSVNINYTASKEAMISSVEQAEIKTIYTSKKFIEKLKDKNIKIEGVFHNSVKLIYLEDLKTQISKFNYICTYLFTKFAPTALVQAKYKTKNTLDSIATILFSSGSEGNPKGVMLSHRNILCNIKQIIEMLNLDDEEIFLGSLPLFHSFGLTVTTFLPIVEGMKVVCHPDPTDAVGIGKAVAKNRATFMCGSSTFFRLYLKNKKLTPLMFESLNKVFAGAEKLNLQVASEFKQKFGVTIYEGYGATECSPVVSVNIPDALDTNYWQIQIGTKIGTVGMPLPGCAVRIVDHQTLKELPHGNEGLILVSGPNVMVGYLKNEEKTKDVLVELDGKVWYKSGDKGKVDNDGFISIVDRYSRFVKLGGEMISLTAVENKIYQCIGDVEGIKLVCVGIPDEKKGEKIVLLIDCDILNLKQQLIESGMNPLWIPAKIQVVEQIPILGSGKIDFTNAKKLALKS